MTDYLLEQIKDRDYFYRKAKRTNNKDDWNIAKHLRNTTNYNVRQARAEFILSELEANSKDQKKFWRTIKKVFPNGKKGGKTTVTLTDNNSIPIPEKEVPNYINDFFINIGQMIAQKNASVAGTPAPNITPNAAIDDFIADKFEVEEVRETEVYKEIMKINIKRSSGLADVNSRVLKTAFKCLTSQLTLIFNMSIKSTTFPDEWKKTTVIPIPKAGDLQKVENYRPISLLPLPGKILERLLHNQISVELENAEYFTQYQHGFRKSHSTLHSTLQLVNQINCNMDKRTPTVAIFIDFRKAFDCVCHDTVMNKIAATNLGPQTVKWIESYLSGRHQHTLVNNIKSDNGRIVQGVPQALYWAHCST